MKQFPFVPASDLVRCRVGNTVWYAHRNWWVSYPWRVYDGDGVRKPKAAMGGTA